MIRRASMIAFSTSRRSICEKTRRCSSTWSRNAPLSSNWSTSAPSCGNAISAGKLSGNTTLSGTTTPCGGIGAWAVRTRFKSPLSAGASAATAAAATGIACRWATRWTVFASVLPGSRRKHGLRHRIGRGQVTRGDRALRQFVHLLKPVVEHATGFGQPGQSDRRRGESVVGTRGFRPPGPGTCSSHSTRRGSPST